MANSVEEFVAELQSVRDYLVGLASRSRELILTLGQQDPERLPSNYHHVLDELSKAISVAQGEGQERRFRIPIEGGEAIQGPMARQDPPG